jgi:hypothetical protein
MLTRHPEFGTYFGGINPATPPLIDSYSNLVGSLSRFCLLPPIGAVALVKAH